MRKKIWRNKYGQPESILSLKRIIGDKEKKFVENLEKKIMHLENRYDYWNKKSILKKSDKEKKNTTQQS